MTRRATLCQVFVIVTLVSAAPLAAQKGKPPASSPGQAVFRCNGSGSNLEAVCADGVVGDGSLYPGSGTPESGAGAHLNANQEFWIGIRDGAMRVRLNFDPSRRVDSPACQSTVKGCRFTLTKFPNSQMILQSAYSELQTNVVDANDVELPNGMKSISVGGLAYARLKITFNDPQGADLLWGFNFVPSQNAGSSLIKVRRPDACTWLITGDSLPTDPDYADYEPIAALQAYGRTGTGKAYRTDEGLFRTPVEITFSLRDCTP